MREITNTEITQFLGFASDSIKKLSSPKNSKKEHWSKVPIPRLWKQLRIEMYELEEAISTGEVKNIINECKDVINISFFIWWNCVNAVRIRE